MIRKEGKRMQRTDQKKQILREVGAALPFMSAEQKGFFRGYAAAMTDRQDEREREEQKEKETA